ncbi:hypothetical protein QCA50_004519 [Cerrena zonata]|uniref:Transmembrane protein n=1 Tax=Cerrena zonata TaxID=2478898 RepID=A0AAW0GPA1_9APHY
MPDWTSPEAQAKQSAALTLITHTFAGIYFWEVLISLDFEWSYISGRRKFRYPIIIYFLARYLALAAMIGAVIGFDVKSGLNCRPFFIFLQMTGNASGGMATINLALRTIAIWERNRYIIIVIVLLILGHWSLILQGGLLEASQIPGTGCVIVHTNVVVLTANFVFSMAFDLVVLILTAYKLLQLRGSHQNGLVNVLFYDGLIYFICAFLANLVATVFMTMNLSPVMSIIFNVPSTVVCAIASTRAVRSLATYAADGPHIFYSGTIADNGSIQFRPHLLPMARPGQILSLSTTREEPSQEGVHVRMERMVRVDEEQKRKSNTRKTEQLDSTLCTYGSNNDSLDMKGTAV